MVYTAAQKKAYGVKMAKARANALAGKAKRASPKVVSGRGAYFKGTAGMRTAKGFGDYDLGEGSSIGSHVGAWLGDKAQNLIKSVAGFGDYVKPSWNPKSNSLLSMGQDPPIVKNSPEGNFIIRHREYLQDIITGTPGQFVVNSYKIQPGLPDTFPWMSITAQCFEQYQLRGMIFEFKSTSADSLNSTNTALGEVIMATEYDSKKPNFASKVDMQNHQYAVAARQSSSMLHPIECAHPLSTLDVLYVRSGQVPEGADSRMYDFGNFQIATVGQQGSNINIGELWVTYEVELLKARLPGEGNIVFSSAYYQSGSVCTSSNRTAAVSNSGTFLVQPDNNLPILWSNNAMTFPNDVGNGTYQVTVEWVGTTTLISGVPVLEPEVGSGIIVGPDSGPFGVMVGPGTGVNSERLCLVYFVYLGTPNPGVARTATFQGGVIPTNSQFNCVITSILTGFNTISFTDIYNPPVFSVAAKKPLRQSPLQARSEEFAIKAEIERLTQLYEAKLARETLAPLSDDEPSAYKPFLHGNYTPNELEAISKEITVKVDDDWHDMTESTAVNIQAIVEKARQKRLAKEQQHKQ